MKVIAVQMADRAWTTQAMHLACSMARNTGSQVVLLHLMLVNTPHLLGFGLVGDRPSRDEDKMIQEYATIAEDYGVEISLQLMQYSSFMDALVQAAEQLDAAAIFARLPKPSVAVLHKVQLWNVKRQLSAQGRQLYTLEQPEGAETAVTAVSLKPIKR